MDFFYRNWSLLFACLFIHNDIWRRCNTSSSSNLTFSKKVIKLNCVFSFLVVGWHHKLLFLFIVLFFSGNLSFSYFRQNLREENRWYSLWHKSLDLFPRFTLLFFSGTEQNTPGFCTIMGFSTILMLYFISIFPDLNSTLGVFPPCPCNCPMVRINDGAKV